MRRSIVLADNVKNELLEDVAGTFETVLEYIRDDICSYKSYTPLYFLDYDTREILVSYDKDNSSVSVAYVENKEIVKSDDLKFTDQDKAHRCDQAVELITKFIGELDFAKVTTSKITKTKKAALDRDGIFHI